MRARYVENVGQPRTLSFSNTVKSSRFPNVPAARLTLHSERTPLTGAQVFLAVDDLTEDIRSSRVTCAELTFDLHYDQRSLARQIFSTARGRTQLTDERGWQTTYVGGPKSGRQLRIYQKTQDVVRLEIILRRQSLIRMGIYSPEELLFLRNVDFRRLISFHELDAARFHRVVDRKVKERWRRRLWRDCSSLAFHPRADDLVRGRVCSPRPPAAFFGNGRADSHDAEALGLVISLQ